MSNGILADCGENFFRMFGRFHFGPDLGDFAVGPDQEGDAVRSVVGPAHELFLPPDVVGFDDPLVFIGD